jgi:ATP-dependent RNA helicase SUPV3L1/SUV3
VTGEPASTAPSTEQRPPRRDRHGGGERTDGDRPRRDGAHRGRPQGKDGHRPESDSGPRRERSGRPDRPRREPRSSEPTRFSTEPPKRDRPADPNSPFAALAALKAELEAKERGG